jgi:hypothetical protein
MGLLFPSRVGTVRKPNNFGRIWRAARGDTFAWITPDADTCHVRPVTCRPGRDAGRRTGSVSTVKLRQAGFTKTIDTEDAFRNALQSLIDRKLLPPTEK